MKTIKTTFELDQKLHTRLKATAARLGVNARELVTEGLEHVLARYAATTDKAELESRLASARERLREGYFDGPSDLSETYENRLLMVASPPPKYEP
jgi:hypothetical protein